ncbi:MAG: type II toxin-antitoxin system VapC family toxin [Candidatus Bathyarchaeota archaeon]|jgi:tRNA(fMet)-specific endonuclease VapC|nr:type II toxin-antitoxin system VapC family toxin [Candidatus Bathyarchaeota archaeon]
MVCLDTSFIIALIRRDERALAKLEEYTASETRLTTTPITACELFKGAYKSTRREKELQKVKTTLGFLEMLNFSVEASERYGKLMASEGLHGAPIGDLDAMIASLALTHGEEIVTSNRKHFERVDGLQVNSW